MSVGVVLTKDQVGTLRKVLRRSEDGAQVFVGPYWSGDGFGAADYNVEVQVPGVGVVEKHTLAIDGSLGPWEAR